MKTDEIISMLNATQDVIEAERQMDDMSPESSIAVLRSSVRTLAVIQRDLLKSVLEP